MKPISECIIITEPMFMGAFCGSDVWVIPIKEWIREQGNDPRELFWAQPIIGIDLDFEKAYVSDRWALEGGRCCMPTKDGDVEEGFEDCAIAVEPMQMMWRTAPIYASMIESREMDKDCERKKRKK